MEPYIRIPLPEIPDNCTVVDVQYGMRICIYYTAVYNQKISMCIHEVTCTEDNPDPIKSWIDGGSLWAEKPDYDTYAMDYVRTNTVVEPWLYWNITSAAKQRYAEGDTTISLALTSDSTSSNCCRAYFDQTKTLVITASYRSTLGTESYYTYETESAGRAGSGCVGDYSGMLTLAETDVSWSSTSMPFTLSHVFNSGLRNENISTTNLSGVPTPNYSAMCTGYGWQLSCQQSVMRQTIGSTTYLAYRDGDGTLHYFKYNSSKGKYVDEDGLNLTIKVNSSTYNEYTMTDTDGNTMYFKYGYLTYMTDGNGNKVCFVYNGASYSSGTGWYPVNSKANQLTSILFLPKGASAAANICTLSYTNNYLSTITDFAGRTTRFSYSNGKLTEIAHPDDTIAYYDYDAASGNRGNQLLSAYDGESHYGVAWEYNEGGRVKEVAEYTADAHGGARTLGGQVRRSENGIQESVYQYVGDDREFDTGDDLYTRYSFDNAGRTINATTLNSDRSEVLGVTAAAYTTNSSTSSTNNRVEQNVQAGQTSVNLLRYSGAESHDGYSSAASVWQKTKTASGFNGAIRDASASGGANVRTGNYALKLWLSDKCAMDGDGHRRGGMYQSVALTGGITYTFSAYVNTSQITNWSTGGAYLAFANGSGVILESGDMVTSNTNESIADGWQRISVTYKPDYSGTYRVQVMLDDAYGITCFDDLQLETGTVPGTVNLLQNGSFSSGGTTAEEWTAGDLQVKSGSDSRVNGDGARCVALNGDTTGMKSGRQEILIGQKADTTYLLSGWGWAWSAANTEQKLTDSTAENSTARYFGLIARCNYADGTKEYFYMPFNDDYHDWQYASCIIAPAKKNQNKTLTSITVICAYYANINYAMFDGISLQQEPCTTYTYNSDGNLTAVNTTGTSGTTMAYAAGTSKLTSVETSSSGTYTYSYDDKNNDHLVTKVTNDDVSLNISYDKYGNSESTTLASDTDNTQKKIVTSAVYSTDGTLLTSQTDSTGARTSYKYNNRQLTSYTGPSGTKTENCYDSKSGRQYLSYVSGRISVSSVFSLGMVTKIHRGTYITVGGAKYYQDYNLSYDSFGNTTAISIGSNAAAPAYTLATYRYSDGNGHLESMTSGNGTTVSYEYDNIGRKTAENWSDGTGYTYYYNANGNLSKILDENSGKAIHYEYDSLGRLLYSSETENDSNTGNATTIQRVEQLYDSNGKLTTQSWTLGDKTYSETFSYDSEDGSLTGVSSTPYADDKFAAYTFAYDYLKRLKSRTNDIYVQTYTYRDRDNNLTTGQVSTISYTAGSTGKNFTSFSLAYGYDSARRITSVTGTGRTDQTASYSYDELGQLTKESNSAGNFTYTYDYAGNIQSSSDGTTTHTYTYGDSEWVDLLTEYDHKVISYDDIGNPYVWYNSTGSWNMSWTHCRQLAAASKNGTSVSYTYNISGIRDSKTVNGTTYSYITQNGQVVRQQWGDNVLDIIYDNNGQPYEMVYNGTHYYYILNQQGDVIALVASNGSIKARYTYNAWGEILSASGTMAAINPLRYRGYYYDTETGLYYLQSRYYDPQVKRFINADGNESTGQGFLGYNMFAYCINCPTNFADCSGDRPVASTSVSSETPSDRSSSFASMKPKSTSDETTQPSAGDVVGVVLNPVALINYGTNKQVDNNPGTTSRGTIINNQNKEGANYVCGFFTAKWNGCEPIAVHNALVSLGYDSTLADAILHCQLYGYCPLGGLIGTYKIDRILKSYGLAVEYVDISEITTPGVYVISFWNTQEWYGQLHTVCVTYDGTSYTTYNYNSNGTEYGSTPQYLVLSPKPNGDTGGVYVTGYRVS